MFAARDGRDIPRLRAKIIFAAIGAKASEEYGELRKYGNGTGIVTVSVS
jgi:hypothetical protein